MNVELVESIVMDPTPPGEKVPRFAARVAPKASRWAALCEYEAVGEERVIAGPELETFPGAGRIALKFVGEIVMAPEPSMAAVAAGAVYVPPPIGVAVTLLVILPTVKLPTVVALTEPPEVRALK